MNNNNNYTAAAEDAMKPVPIEKFPHTKALVSTEKYLYVSPRAAMPISFIFFISTDLASGP
jgi:hypothetical protein